MGLRLEWGKVRVGLLLGLRLGLRVKAGMRARRVFAQHGRMGH